MHKIDSKYYFKSTYLQTILMLIILKINSLSMQETYKWLSKTAQSLGDFNLCGSQRDYIGIILIVV